MRQEKKKDFMRGSRLRFLGVWCVLLTLLPWACVRKTVPFATTPDKPLSVTVADTLTRTADSLRGKPSLSTARKVVMTKEEERLAKEKEKEAQRKPKKKKKLFLGERIKRAYVKSGAKGRNQVIEVFYYLRYFQQPNAYAPARYYYNSKKRKIFKASGELDPAADKILHGPYKKMQNNKVLETGFYSLGTKHLRWERFDKNGILLTKIHYEQGFPRDANISYYGNDRGLINEVVPYVNGKLEGEYAKFLIDGQREWQGQFENNRRVGEWTNYYGFKNRRHYIYQYPESGYDPEVTEPELLRQYNRGGIVVFDKEKNIDKRGDPDVEVTPGKRGVPSRAVLKAAPKVAPKRR